MDNAGLTGDAGRMTGDLSIFLHDKFVLSFKGKTKLALWGDFFRKAGVVPGGFFMSGNLKIHQ